MCVFFLLDMTTPPWCREKVMVYYRAWGVLKSVLSKRGLRINARKCLCEIGIVPTALYGAEAWSMRNADRRKVKILDEVSEKFGWSVTNG